MIFLPKDARPVPGFVAYWATPDGRIFSGWKPHAGGVAMLLPDGYAVELPGTIANHGYRMVGMGSRSDGSYRFRQVHIIILETFVGPRPDGYDCRHLDGDPLNNALSNLTWGTKSENAADTHRHGRKRRFVIPEDVWPQIAAEREAGAPIHKLAQKYGVTNMSIHGGLRDRWPELVHVNRSKSGGMLDSVVANNNPEESK